MMLAILAAAGVVAFCGGGNRRAGCHDSERHLDPAACSGKASTRRPSKSAPTSSCKVDDPTLPAIAGASFTVT